MFLFFHTNQTLENSSYYKGKLFEELLKEFLNQRGYDVALRILKDGAEYDIVGKDRTAGFKIIGEAKAYSEKITVEKFTAFLGRFNPLGIDKSDKRGLFLSTSHLTPDAKEFYMKLREKDETVKVIAGNELFEEMKKEFNLVVSPNLQARLMKNNYAIRTNSILMSDVGIFLVIICSSHELVNPSFFLLINEKGDEISDNDFITNIKHHVKELKDLYYIKIDDAINPKFEKQIGKGLIVGKNWIDYRLPAAPQYFIGRESIIREINECLENNSGSNIIQIKSRSGEGKSSLLSFLENEFSKKNIHTELHDARNIKSVLNIFYIIQRFTKSYYLANNFEDVEKQIASLFNNEEIEKAVLMVDQFESTYMNSDVFSAYEYLMNIIFDYREKLFVIIARKSDLIASYDDRVLSLEKINSISNSIELTDFQPDEAKILIEKIDVEAHNKISLEVKSYVFRFASGFPWSLKRTMAHILKMLRSGFTSNELLERNLSLEDLFLEELRGLDQEEKGYLKRIVNYLPAAISDIQLKFSENVRLKMILEKLTAAKILRLTDDIYDTYNDVFKDYLKTGKTPEYHPPIIYRISPNSVLRLFHNLIHSKNQIFPLESIQSISKTKKGYTFALAKELSNLNLLKNSGGNYWELPNSVREFYNKNRLGEYVREQILTNDLVNKLKKCLENRITITTQTLSSFLSEQFPFQEIEANEKTWTAYSNCLINWLELTKIIVIGENHEFLIPTEDDEIIVHALGNLTELLKRPESFLPTATFSKVEKCFIILRNDINTLKDLDYNAMYDLKNGGWLINDALNVNEIKELRQQAIDRITSESHNKIWEAAKNDEYLYKKFKDIFGETYTDNTCKVMLNRLLNWGKALGIIPNKRYKQVEREAKSFTAFKIKRELPQKLREKRKLQSEIIWEIYYKELEEYINVNKDSCVPRNGSTKKLGYWVTSVRMKRKRKQLPEEKIDALNQINFDWEPVKNIWNKRYRDLLNFREIYAHTHVPKEYDEKLYFWVKNQRMNVYTGKINPERKELLLKIGLLDPFTPSQSALIQINIMNLLNEFYNKHGHINVPQLDKEYKNLGRWINDQRVMRKRRKMNPNREKLLESMNIIWDAKENHWDKKLNELDRFHKKYGHFNVTRRNVDFPGMGKWIYDLKRSKKISDERIQKLLKIGFDWEKEKFK